MFRTRQKSAERVESIFNDIGETRNLPDLVSDALPLASAATPEQSSGRSWVRTGLRFMTNAAIGLLMLTVVPLAVVGVFGGRFMVTNSRTYRDKFADVERLRPLTLPKDASMAPSEAELAFGALQAPPSSPGFPTRASGAPTVQPWHQLTLTPDMFPNRMPYFVGPSPTTVIEASTKGFSKNEMQWLKALAEAPVWEQVDRVARAPSIDMISARYVLPFRADAFALSIPATRFAETKELAYAGISRAAYYVANGQPDQAEAALRSVVSYGFALMDNSTNSLDALIGRVVAGIGQNGLEQFYRVTHRELPAGVGVLTRTASKPVQLANAQNTSTIGVEAMRQRLLADADNASLPPGLRYEVLMRLSFVSCSNVKEMLFGPRQDVRDAFARAKTTLARFPAERAYLDLIYEAPNRMPEDALSGSPIGRFIVGTATVAGTVLNNPRIVACTRIAMQL